MLNRLTLKPASFIHNIGETGLETIIRISRDIGNGMTNKLLKKIIPIPIHSISTNIKPSSVRAKHKRLDSEDQQSNIFVRRSQVPQLNLRKYCFYYTIVVTRFESTMMNREERSFTGLKNSGVLILEEAKYLQCTIARFALHWHFITSTAFTWLMIQCRNPSGMIDINLEQLQHIVTFLWTHLVKPKLSYGNSL